MAPEIMLRNYDRIGIFFVDNSGNIFLLIENRQEHTTVRLRRMKYSHFVTFVIIAGILIA